jgi:hypothetical protein
MPVEAGASLEQAGRVIAALYVETGGAYYGLPDVDPWDEERDARNYPGPFPVVAHPPCSSWCQLAPVNLARWGSPIGDDAGTFAAALESVRTFGGVLEHPAYSLAWAEFGLPRPSRGWWSASFHDVGFVTEVSQCAYGHAARKRTWLYAVRVDLPALDWSEPAWSHVIGNGVNAGESCDMPKLDKTIQTPTAFRDVLLDMARSVA